MSAPTPEPAPTLPDKPVIFPTPGEVITSLRTNISYTMGDRIGEGFFGVVFQCVDGWQNDLAAKVLKPTGTYEQLHAAALAEIQKLFHLRHPHITYLYDAFEYRNTFYIITERCYRPLTELFNLEPLHGLGWIIPIARCVLQAVHYLHINQYAHQDIHLNNVYAAFSRDEMRPQESGAINFKVGDLGVSKVFGELDAANTLNNSIKPPEALDPAQFGPLDHRIDIYHLGLLFLQLAYAKRLQFTAEEVLQGRPREMAEALPPPYNFALAKALRRHSAYRTNGAEELWRDLRATAPTSVEPAPSGGDANT